MKTKKVLLTFITATLMLISVYVTNGLSSPVPTLNIAWMAEKADIICKGKVVEIHDDGPKLLEMFGQTVSVEQNTAIFRVDRIIKGQVGSQNISIEFLTSCTTSFDGLYNEESALVFLGQPSDGKYHFVHPYMGTIPITSKKVSTDKLDISAMLEQELVGSLTENDRELVLTVITQLAKLQRVSSVMPLRTMLKSSDREIKSQTYGALISLGDYEILDDAVNFLNQLSREKDLEPEVIDRYQAKISYPIASIDKKPLVNKLHKYLKSPNVKLRQSVTKALREIKDRSSVPFLINNLDDEDLDVRYDSLITLAQIEDKESEYAPAVDNFEENPQPFIDRWKKWWQSEGKPKYSALIKE